MPASKPDPINRFMLRLGRSARAALLLDYDGTLAPFVNDRDAAHPYPGTGAALEALLDAGNTRLGIISGRTVAELLALLPLSDRIELWGCHGLQRRRPGQPTQTYEIGDTARAALEHAAVLAGKVDEQRVETKPGCVAFHVRGLAAPTASRQLSIVSELWQACLDANGLLIQKFDGGIELRSVLATKARSVRRVIAEEGAATPIAYLGDDLTDEDAFQALRQQDLAVLVRPRRRASAAKAWLRPPEELFAFLAMWREQLGTAVQRQEVM